MDEERQGAAAQPQYIETVDEEEIPADSARRLSRNLFYAGFALLPWLWFSNIWLFWPQLWSSSDQHVRQYARGSAIGFVVASAIVLPWTLTFMIGGPGVVGQRVFDKMNLAGVDLSALGLAL
ncbi:g878 [Coccomyxa viridis]|uniref:G878 protein n=1 Tax=Coccomyxa viridis TaxID=1274662 RepID=A0ABP1FKH0_9CHLO